MDVTEGLADGGINRTTSLSVYLWGNQGFRDILVILERKESFFLLLVGQRPQRVDVL